MAGGEVETRVKHAAFAQHLLMGGRRWRTRVNERLREIGQTEARYAALAAVAASERGLLQRELSEVLGVEDPTVVRLVDILEAQGWAERQVNAHDRRGKYVRVRPEGAVALAEAEDVVVQVHEELLSDFTAEEIETCVRVLSRLGVVDANWPD